MKRTFYVWTSIIADHGWPSPELVGNEANAAAWLLVQHASLERQKRLLPVLRDIVRANQDLGKNLALLEDEIALADTGEQIYGTEIKMLNDNVFIAPIMDPGKLDDRRASIGLPPMEEYLEEAEREIGLPIDRSALSAR